MPRAVMLFTALMILTADDPTLTPVQKHGNAGLWLARPANDPLSVKLSETLTIVMRVEGDAPLEVELTEKMHSNEGWHLALQGQPTKQLVDDGRRARWEQIFLATPLKPGSFPLKLPALQFTEKNGKEQSVSWEPLPLRITTRVTKVEVGEARDRIAIEELPPLPPVSPPPRWPWLLAVLPLAGVVFFVARRWRRRSLPSPPPSEVALKELDELSHLTAATAEEAKGLYTRLSDVLRRYLELRLGLPATQRTTAEFFASLTKASPFGQQARQMLSDVLRRCDLAKFAGIVPAGEETRQAVEAARDFVKQTEADLAAKSPKRTSD